MSYSDRGIAELEYSWGPFGFSYGGFVVKELIDHIPFIDIGIVGLLALFIYLGWRNGTAKMLIILGSIYTGFLLASIYYHIFAVALRRALGIRNTFVGDFTAFLMLDLLVTLLMLALLLGLFGHLEVGKGRAMMYDRVTGTILGAVTSVLLAAIVVTTLWAPYEANKQKLDANKDLAVVSLFNDGFSRSPLAAQVKQTSPLLLSSVKPLLPAEARESGAVPLFQSVVAKKQQ
jgi:uncharacterized membrane protein required for colicin V production